MRDFFKDDTEKSYKAGQIMFLRFFIFVLFAVNFLKADELNIYIDADFSAYIQSSKSIEMGILTAIQEHNELLGDTKIKVVRLNHKGNSLRSLKNIKTFLKDKNRLALFSGIHSPPLLANRNFINSNKALFMIPWAAAAPITRPTEGENWIFRLSVDDSKAGSFLVNEMTKAKYSRPFLLLEKTGWGQNNSKNINKSLSEKSINPAGQEFFNWGPTDTNVRIKIRKIEKSKADCILFVGNAREGEIFAKSMNEAGVNIPVISHWGITGGGFFESVGKEILKKQHWSFIQTKFSFPSSKLNDYQTEVLKTAKELFPNDVNGKHIKSPTGFIHAHDLTVLLLKAWGKTDKKVPVNFKSLHQHLENLDEEIEGLAKKYKNPFSKYSQDNKDAHEALGFEDLKLGVFDEEGNVILK